MSKPLQLFELTPSPNSQKVRIGLGYKGLAHERIPVRIDAVPGDRSLPLEVSRQPRLPVLRHGEVVLFDSGAILRYLEANFPGAPSLVVSDYAAFGEMEEWEAWSRSGLGAPIGALFRQLVGGAPDPAAIAQANADFHGATARIEAALAEGSFLLGTEHPTIADVTCATRVGLALLGEAEAASSPLLGGFRATLELGPERERTRAWAEGLLAHDAHRAALLRG